MITISNPTLKKKRLTVIEYTERSHITHDKKVQKVSILMLRELWR